MITFALGMLGGVVLVLLLMLLAVRVAGKALDPAPHSNALPDLTLSVTRELTQRLVDDALREIRLPLVTMRDPYVQLEPGGVVVLRLRGDTALLGAQTIVLRLRVEPAGSGVRVASESAMVQGLGSVPAALTDRLDQTINAQLCKHLGFGRGWEVLSVDGDEHAIEVRARLL
jgi:hypothetical protein